MIIRTWNSLVRSVLPALIFTLGLSSVSWGAEYWLRAEKITKTMPNTGEVVTMWGFGPCTIAYTTCDPATVPGPRLTVPSGDTTLTINLRNNLTGPFVEPVSLVIPGQIATMSPVMSTADAQGRKRVKSFTTETPPDNTTTIAYTWNNMKPGTFLYQSGSHPAVQVQMGLYGAVTKDFAAGQAYDPATAPATAYATEALLLFSEIDPVLHSQVAAGTYGTTGMTSTLNYAPKYFLINGEPYSTASVPLPAGSVGTSVLLRFLSASLEVRVPVIQGTHLSIVAEDGNTFPFAKQQYSAKLPPGKTTDAIFTPTVPGNYAVYDRRLALTNGAASGGGMLVNLNVGPALGLGQGVGIFRDNGLWYVDSNRSGAWDGGDVTFVFGSAGDIPVTGNWSGDGITKAGIFRGNGDWYLDTNGTRAWDLGDSAFTFGSTGDIPVTGDWSGSGTAKVGVFRGNGLWYLDANGSRTWDAGDTVYTFGSAGDIPVTGDWNGTGTAKVGVFRGNGEWWLDLNGSGAWDAGDAMFTFGSTGDIPVTGDWNGDGLADVGVMRGNGLWYLDVNGSRVWDAGDVVYTFGSTGDKPITGAW